MNYDLTLYEFLKTKIKPIYITIRKDETRIRCPFCGDSTKDKTHAHLYINNTPPFKFYCQRCSTTGIFNMEMLNALNAFSKDISNYLNASMVNYKKKINIKYGNTYYNYFKNVNKEIYIPKEFTNLEKEKVLYFENRMGFKLNTEDFKRYKIILDIEKYLELNKINIDSDRKKDLIHKLNLSSVGFLLNDGNTITCRYLNPIDKRYFNLRIFG